MLTTIEMQQSIAQLHAMEKIQQVQQQHADLQQRHFASQLHEERKRLKEKVNDADEAEFRRLQEREADARSGGRRDEAKRRSAVRGPSEEPPEETAVEEGSRIDIRV
ncbi:MAG: hypothetical protein QM278_10580 [Pseudomonadota bacterium]|nr:hypothetical protein [Pseudomonadota bacterium]